MHHAVLFNMRRVSDRCIYQTFSCIVECPLTTLRGDLLEINDQADIVIWLWFRLYKTAIFPRKHLANAISDQLIPATDVHGE